MGPDRFSRLDSKAPQSSAELWGPLTKLVETERAVGRRMAERPANAFLYEFLRFGMKQAWACLFGGVMVALLIGTHYAYPAGAPLARYDFLFGAAVIVQALLLYFRLETIEEAKVILLYHVIGTLMELFKTKVGSWIYPEPCLIHLGGVPLFSGFMYASIGSYIARAWRLFDFRFQRHPPLWTLALLSGAIYANFFTHHYMIDLRWALIAASFLCFFRTRIYFRNWRTRRWMPLLLGLFLVALFIWLAENIGTFSGAWRYPDQLAGWAMVRLGKLGSWFLLLMISYTLVAFVNRPVDIDDSATGRD
jgi:uncharacterized membrane protein YoaT (DUF817 family)